MRLLFLCQYFPPEPGAPAARTFEHAREWARMGHDVTVVCGVPNHPDGEIPPAYRNRFVYEECLEGVRVLRCWFWVAPNRGVVRRTLAFASFMAAAFFWALARGGRCDVVIATSPQLLCALAGYAVAAIRRSPFVLEVRDLWPRQIVDLGVIRNERLIRLLYGLERFLYERARAIVTVAEAAAQDIVRRGTPPEKVHVVTNGIDLTLFAPKPRIGRMRHLYGWRDETLVMYIGTHGLSQGLETVLEAAARLAERSDIRFVFIGSGAQRPALMARAETMGLSNIVFIPSQPRGDMPDFYAAADICLAPLKKLEVFLTNIPSKIFEIMACARPVLLGAEGQARRVLEAAGAGIALPPEDPDALAAAIAQLADRPELCRRYGENGRRHVEAEYDRAAKARAFLDIVTAAVASDTEKRMPH